MTEEATARNYAENLETYLLSKTNNLGREISDLISNLKTTPWENMYSKTMIYRILSDEERLSTLRTKLPFLSANECELIKLHIDYIVYLCESGIPPKPIQIPRP